VKKKIKYSKKKSKKRGSHSKRISFGRWIFILLLFAAVIVAGYSLYRLTCTDTATMFIPPEENVKVADNLERRDRGKPQVKASSGADEGNRVAIVIDDMGYDLQILDEILNTDAPITISILPHLAHSVEVSRKANMAGREVILHLPMEPDGYPARHPGSGALLLRMDRDEIIDQLEENIMDVPHISGVNNHMGSKFMEDEEKVEIVLNQLKQKGLFFLDSLTTRNSKGIQIAKKIGLRHVGRDIFLDNDCDFDEALDILIRIAKRKNSWKTIVIIGHPHKSTIQAIRQALPIFRDKGIHLVPLSDLVQ